MKWGYLDILTAACFWGGETSCMNQGGWTFGQAHVSTMLRRRSLQRNLSFCSLGLQRVRIPQRSKAHCGLTKQQMRRTVWLPLHSSQNVKISVTGQEEVVSYRIKNVLFMVCNLGDEWAGATKDPGSFQGFGLKATVGPASNKPPWRKCGKTFCYIQNSGYWLVWGCGESADRVKGQAAIASFKVAP